MAKENQENAAVAVAAPQQTNLVFDTIEHFESAQRMCRCLVTANMLPDSFRGEANIGNCMIALEIAHRGRLPIMEVFQNLVTVKGRISWYATYLIGRVNSCGKYSTLTWDSENDGTQDWRMRAKAVELATGEVLTGAWVSLKMAKAENWGSKWETMPEQMLRYRSAAFWVRTHCPNITMGVRDQYETEDILRNETAQAGAAEAAAATQEEKRAKAKSALKDALNFSRKPDAKKAEDAKISDAQDEARDETKEPAVVKITVEKDAGQLPPKQMEMEMSETK